MLKDVKLSKIAELIGHVPQTLRNWKNSDSSHDVYKYEAVTLGVTLMENGFKPEQVLFLMRYGFKMNEMAERIKELEDALIEVGCKLESIRPAGSR